MLAGIKRKHARPPLQRGSKDQSCPVHALEQITDSICTQRVNLLSVAEKIPQHLE